MGQTRKRQVDEARADESGNAAIATGNASVAGNARNTACAWHSGRQTFNGETEHAPRAAAQAWAAEHPACAIAESAETDAVGALDAANTTGSAAEAHSVAAFESVDSAGAE